MWLIPPMSEIEAEGVYHPKNTSIDHPEPDPDPHNGQFSDEVKELILYSDGEDVPRKSFEFWFGTSKTRR